MATQAASSHGTALSVLVEGVYTRIAEVLDINGPSMNVPTESIYADDPGSYPGIVSNGVEAHELSFDINYTGVSTQALLISALQAQTVLEFKLEFPGASVGAYQFSGLVTSFEPTAPVDGVLTASVAIVATSSLAIV